MLASAGWVAVMENKSHPIFIIALDSDYRNPELARSLSLLGSVKEPAGGHVYNAQDDVQLNHDFSIAFNRSELSKGEIGCAIAHIKSYEWLLKSSESFLMVVEDDAVLTRDFNVEAFRSLMEVETPVLLLLGRHSYDLPFRKKHVGIFGGVRFFADSLPPSGSYAYLVNKPAAKIMATEMDYHGLNFVADWPLAAVEKVNFLYCDPPLFSAGQATSTIQRATTVDRSLQIRSLFRAIKLLSRQDRNPFVIIWRIMGRHVRIFIRRRVRGLRRIGWSRTRKNN